MTSIVLTQIYLIKNKERERKKKLNFSFYEHYNDKFKFFQDNTGVPANNFSLKSTVK